MAPALRAGVAGVVTTRPVGITHAHWGAQTHTCATAVDLDLWAAALAVANGDTQVAIVDCDTGGYPNSLVAQIRGVITQLTGIPETHVRVSASQTHSGGNVSPAWYDDGREMIGPYVASVSSGLF